MREKVTQMNMTLSELSPATKSMSKKLLFLIAVFIEEKSVLYSATGNISHERESQVSTLFPS
jgi:hypothetical protein